MGFQLDGWMFYKTLVDGTGLDGIFLKGLEMELDWMEFSFSSIHSPLG
jgi:hypothetical protein